ncbi:MAG: hypothetical protein ACKOZU_05125 [Planctomycetaceae bacterium]
MTLLTALIVVPVSRRTPAVAPLLPIENVFCDPDTTNAWIAYGVPMLLNASPLVVAVPRPSNTATSLLVGNALPTQFVVVAQPVLALAPQVRSAARVRSENATESSAASVARTTPTRRTRERVVPQDVAFTPPSSKGVGTEGDPRRSGSWGGRMSF